MGRFLEEFYEVEYGMFKLNDYDIWFWIIREWNIFKIVIEENGLVVIYIRSFWKRWEKDKVVLYG